jgi:hypothetical protein
MLGVCEATHRHGAETQTEWGQEPTSCSWSGLIGGDQYGKLAR